MSGISVVVCCYNSGQRLPATLFHLSRQVVVSDWEVLLVDNASTDNTPYIAKDIWEDLSAPVKLTIVTEPNKGIHNARLTGIKNAKHGYIVFCDDDNWLDENYLSNVFSIMEGDAGIGVCGGTGIAAFQNDEPGWFGQYKGVFACGRQSESEGYLGWGNIGLYSAGMAVRKSAIMKILDTGYTSLFSARVDDKLSGGEDLELVVLLRTLGFKAYYSEQLIFKHYMPANRMTWSYLKRIVKGATINTAPAYIYADTLRSLYTGDPRYKVSWTKDIIKAIYGAFLVPVKRVRDIEIVWIKLYGAVASVIRNIPHYPMYKRQIERIYQLTHKTD